MSKEYKIEVNEIDSTNPYGEAHIFPFGFLFNKSDDKYYINYGDGALWSLGMSDKITNFLELIEEANTKEVTGNVSESFALKMLSVALCNTIAKDLE